MAAEQRQPGQAGVPAGVTAAGSPLPDAELLDAHGQPTTVTAARDGKPAVVVFYRDAWCDLHATLHTGDEADRRARFGSLMLWNTSRAA